MKIAFIFDLPLGGALKALSDMEKTFSSFHEVDVYELHEEMRPQSYINSIKNSYCKYSNLKGFWKLFNPLIMVLNLVLYYNCNLKLAKMINDKNYDLCIVHPSCFLQHPFVIKFLKPFTIVYSQEQNRRLFKGETSENWKDILKSIYYFPANMLYRISDKKNISSADEVWCNSEFTAANLKRIYNINPLVFYLGLDTAKYCNFNLKREDSILSVGTLFKNKAHDFIIRSLSMSKFKNNLTLKIIHARENNELMRSINNLSKTLGVKTEFLCGVDEQRLVEEYNKAKLVLYFPEREPFGLVPLEAMSCGTPVVAINEGGPRETVTDSSGGVLAEKNEILVAETIDDLINDDDKRENLSHKGIRYTKEEWTWEKKGAMMLQQLESIQKKIKK